jgi:hypothetical protein
MSPCSHERDPSSTTVLLLQEHQRPVTPCAAAPGCRPDVTTARRFLRWFGRLGRPTMGKQGMCNVSQGWCRSVAVLFEKLPALYSSRRFCGHEPTAVQYPHLVHIQNHCLFRLRLHYCFLCGYSTVTSSALFMFPMRERFVLNYSAVIIIDE